MRLFRVFSVRLIVVAGLAGLSACASLSDSTNSANRTQIGQNSQAESESNLTQQYLDFEAELRADNRLITASQNIGISFDNQDLLQNFLTISLFTERFEGEGEGDLIASGGESPLIRWEQPIKYRVFSNSYKDSILVSLTARSLKNATQHSITAASEQEIANLKILILTAEERKLLREDLIDSAQIAFLDLWLDNPLFPCAGSLATHPQNNTIEQAVIFIKDEVGPFLRSACIEEEFAQALGPINDSILARPSQFNDDFEFGYLTDHDQWILKLLYDPRLKAGMSLVEAAPIVAQLIQEQRPESGYINVDEAIEGARIYAKLPELIAKMFDEQHIDK